MYLVARSCAISGITAALSDTSLDVTGDSFSRGWFDETGYPENKKISSSKFSSSRRS